MKTYKALYSFILTALIMISIPVTVYANSSWHWVSKTRPLDLLPIVIVITLLIEIISINFIPKIRNLKLVIPSVGLANIVSFLMPYFYEAVTPENPYSLYWGGNDYLSVINYTVDRGPVYTISAVYLFVTLLVETPIVYLIFRNRVESKRILFATIIGANVLTTIITIIIEQTMCYGVW